jgi:DNA sulfur modification protein DndB
MATPAKTASPRAGHRETRPTLTFPVIRGVQARREYYIAMWTLRMLRQISIFDEDELPPELRAQRTLNRARIPEISDYILDNPDDYVFSALTVSIDSEVSFEPLPDQDRLGLLRVPMEAHFIINDGQHRRAAIIEAINQRPDLAHETIAVVFFLDIGLARCQQMFADLNRYAIRPSRSLGLLYDHRDDKARLARQVIAKSELFRDIVDMEHSSLAKRSRKLFTLSAFYNACAELVDGMATGNLEEDADLARRYWEALAEAILHWAKVISGDMPASEVREGYIHSHGIALQAIGMAGNSLIKAHPADWLERLKAVADMDWSRHNAALWEGRALVGGRVTKATNNVILTANAVKQALGLPLDDEQQRVEGAYRQGRGADAAAVPSSAPRVANAFSQR